MKSSTICGLEGRHRASLDALDRLPVGVIPLDESGGIIAANREADRLLRQTLAAGGLIALSRPSGKRPLTVLAAPVGKRAFAADARTPSVILFIADPESKPESLAGALARLYHFTAAESRVAELLMHGETLVRTAQRLGVSHNTARTHLQRIYQKTETTHQGDLVRLLLAGPAGFLAAITCNEPPNAAWHLVSPAIPRD